MNYSTAGFELVLTRKMSFYIITYYLPSGLFVVVSWIRWEQLIDQLLLAVPLNCSRVEWFLKLEMDTHQGVPNCFKTPIPKPQATCKCIIFLKCLKSTHPTEQFKLFSPIDFHLPDGKSFRGSTYINTKQYILYVVRFMPLWEYNFLSEWLYREIFKAIACTASLGTEQSPTGAPNTHITWWVCITQHWARLTSTAQYSRVEWFL